MGNKYSLMEQMTMDLLKEVSSWYAASLYGGYELTDQDIKDVLEVVAKNWPHNKQAMKEAVLNGPYPVPAPDDLPETITGKSEDM
jgi:mono/diheme cytochrome c family protein